MFFQWGKGNKLLLDTSGSGLSQERIGRVKNPTCPLLLTPTSDMRGKLETTIYIMVRPTLVGLPDIYLTCMATSLHALYSFQVRISIESLFLFLSMRQKRTSCQMVWSTRHKACLFPHHFLGWTSSFGPQTCTSVVISCLVESGRLE